MNYIEKIVKEICDEANIVYGEEDVIGKIIAKHILASQKDTYIAIEAERYLYSSEQ